MPTEIFGELYYTEKIEELARRSNRVCKDQAIAVVRTDWAEPEDYSLDFYTVKEVDREEGRISCESIACYQNNGSQWITRSRTLVDFWVEIFEVRSQSYAVSYVHPKDRKGVPEPEKGWTVGFCFNASSGIEAARLDTKKKRGFFGKLRKTELVDCDHKQLDTSQDTGIR